MNQPRASRGFSSSPLKPLIAWPRGSRRIMDAMNTAVARFILGTTLSTGFAMALVGCKVGPESMPKDVLYEKASEAELEGDSQIPARLLPLVIRVFPLISCQELSSVQSDGAVGSALQPTRRGLPLVQVKQIWPDLMR